MASDFMIQPDMYLLVLKITLALILIFDIVCAYTCAVHIWKSEDTCYCIRSRLHLPDSNKRPTWKVRRITLNPDP